MTSNVRNQRLLMTMALVIFLPVGGFLWSIPDYHLVVYLIALCCLVLLLRIESLNQLTEQRAKVMQLKLNSDVAEFDEWREKVRQLDRLVAQMSYENDEFRREALEKAVHDVEQAAADPSAAGAKLRTGVA